MTDQMGGVRISKTHILRNIILGAFWCHAGMFIVAPIVALVYQFPAWPNGKVSGLTCLSDGWDGLLEDLVGSIWITLFFALIQGGVLVLAIFGGLAGLTNSLMLRQSAGHLRWKIICSVLLIDLLIAVYLALIADQLAPSLTFRS